MGIPILPPSTLNYITPGVSPYIGREGHRVLTLTASDSVTIDLEELGSGEFDPNGLAEVLTELGLEGLVRDPLFMGQLAGKEAPSVVRQVRIVTSINDLAQVVAAAKEAGRISMYTEAQPMEAGGHEVIGFSVFAGLGQAFYVPLSHQGQGEVKQLPVEVVAQSLGPVLSDPQVLKVGHDLKYEMGALLGAGFSLAGVSIDTMLAAYLLTPGVEEGYSLDRVAAEYLGVRLISPQEVRTQGGEQVGLEAVPVGQAAKYCAEAAWAIWALADRLGEALLEEGLEPLFRDVEVPLVEVLAEMELAGVAVDEDKLTVLAEEFRGRRDEVEKEIHLLAGEKFNIGSQAELSQVLFEKLRLPTGPRTKTGFYSTEREVLENLATEYPVAGEVLKWRQFTWLRAFCASTLAGSINADTGRIHASFNQMVVVSGRLSISEPPLQGTPGRSDEGRKVREAFMAGLGRKLVCADYSQLDLRVAAHLSRDPRLIEAFENDEDIHARTAAEVARIDLKKVTPDMRRMAKEVNFGILFGMGPAGLGRRCGVSTREAKSYRDKWFRRYHGVDTCRRKVWADAAETGEVRTLLGRRRPFPKLDRKGKRDAFATFVQGSATDLVKMAMIKLYRRLKEEGWPARITLQVHDELLVEVDADKADEVAEALSANKE